MDPLSVIASVAGIITTAGEAVKILSPSVTATNDAPQIAGQLLSEIVATQAILSGLQQLAGNFSQANSQYASLIRVDQLITVLTDGVLIFSELYAILGSLPPVESSTLMSRLWTSMQWVWKQGYLTATYGKLQSFKLSINCILSILQR